MTDFDDLVGSAAIDFEFLTWIRTLGCAFCGKKAHVHHLETVGMGHKRGKSQSGSDYSAIPICITHHNQIEGLGVKDFQAQNPNYPNVWHIAWKNLEKWHVWKAGSK